ncbi:MAG: glucuronate isomerase [Clostridia bacterium]|nr:glucuronate isomerase [Clostridia bacterium]
MIKEYLLNSNKAKELYEFAEQLPIIDYHNHLSVADISENKRFTDIYDLWIKPDPYKHRAMRMCGVPEKYITGNASDFEKFKAWCSTVPKLIGNPLYIWSQMELETVFGISELPNKDNAEVIYEKANLYLLNNEITPESLLKKFNVEMACPCMSLTDNFSVIKNKTTIAPSLRGDDITAPDIGLIHKLETLTNKINNLFDYKRSIQNRLDEIEKVGCRFTDHALDNGFKFYADDGENDKRFELLLKSKLTDAKDFEKLFSYLLVFLCGEYAKRNMTVQLHIGAERYTSTRLRTLAGAAGGFAGIGNSIDIKSFTQMIDTLEQGEYGLPKMVLFTLNPADNAMISVLSGSYNKDNVSGLITQGPAWWWCDHKYGIIEVLENTSSFGLLSNFVGMTTDSRSFLSFVRHDYFRRILCDWLAKKLENNELCCGIDDLRILITDMCYNNAKR